MIERNDILARWHRRESSLQQSLSDLLGYLNPTSNRQRTIIIVLEALRAFSKQQLKFFLDGFATASPGANRGFLPQVSSLDVEYALHTTAGSGSI